MKRETSLQREFLFDESIITQDCVSDINNPRDSYIISGYDVSTPEDGDSDDLKLPSIDADMTLSDGHNKVNWGFYVSDHVWSSSRNKTNTEKIEAYRKSADRELTEISQLREKINRHLESIENRILAAKAHADALRGE